MKKITILAFMLCSSLLSCKDIASESNMDRETMIINLLKDKDYQELKNAESNYFKIIKEEIQASAKVDWDLIKKRKPKSKDEYVRTLRDAGMKNPERYVDNKLRIMSAMLKVKEKHPEFKSLSKLESSNLFKEANIRFEKNRIKDNLILSK